MQLFEERGGRGIREEDQVGSTVHLIIEIINSLSSFVKGAHEPSTRDREAGRKWIGSGTF